MIAVHVSGLLSLSAVVVAIAVVFVSVARVAAALVGRAAALGRDGPLHQGRRPARPRNVHGQRHVARLVVSEADVHAGQVVFGAVGVERKHALVVARVLLLGCLVAPTDAGRLDPEHRGSRVTCRAEREKGKICVNLQRLHERGFQGNALQGSLRKITIFLRC